MVDEKLFVDEALLVLGVAVNFDGFDHAKIFKLV
jgi:hypothetical protein